MYWRHIYSHVVSFCPSTTSSSVNPTSTVLGLNTSDRDEKQATDRLSCGTAELQKYIKWLQYICYTSALLIGLRRSFNNQPDALIIPILFCYKTLHVSGIFCAHHQGLSTAQTAIGTLHASYVTTS